MLESPNFQSPSGLERLWGPFPLLEAIFPILDSSIVLPYQKTSPDLFSKTKLDDDKPSDDAATESLQLHSTEPDLPEMYLEGVFALL